MGRVRLGLFSWTCLCVALALVAESASATENLPSYGKCEALAGGKYLNASCTKLATTAEKQKFEWHPLEATVPFRQSKERNTGSAVLELAGGIQITCRASQSATGEYGPANEEKDVVMVFDGCLGGGAGCNSEGRPAEEVATRKLHGEPGVVKKEAHEEKNIDGTDLVAEEGENVAEFFCGPAPVVMRGGIVTRTQADSTGGTTGELTNKQLTKYEVEYVAVPTGVQSPREWTPNGSGTSHITREAVVEHPEMSYNEKVFQESSLSLTTVQESVPTTAKVELRQCESNIVC